MITTRILKTHDEQIEFLSKDLKPFIPFFTVCMMGFRTYIVALEDNAVVGLVSLTEETLWHENCLGVGFVSTHVNHRNKGVSTALVKALFEYARTSGKGISNTKYEPDGEKYLKPVMTRVAAAHSDVKFIERV